MTNGQITAASSLVFLTAGFCTLVSNPYVFLIGLGIFGQPQRLNSFHNWLVTQAAVEGQHQADGQAHRQDRPNAPHGAL
jgi:hypothetical protein